MKHFRRWKQLVDTGLSHPSNIFSGTKRHGPFESALYRVIAKKNIRSARQAKVRCGGLRKLTSGVRFGPIPRRPDGELKRSDAKKPNSMDVVVDTIRKVKSWLVVTDLATHMTWGRRISIQGYYVLMLEITTISLPLYCVVIKIWKTCITE